MRVVTYLFTTPPSKAKVDSEPCTRGIASSLWWSRAKRGLPPAMFTGPVLAVDRPKAKGAGIRIIYLCAAASAALGMI